MRAALTGFSRRTVRSTTDTLGVGTRKAMPVSLLKYQTKTKSKGYFKREQNQSSYFIPFLYVAPWAMCHSIHFQNHIIVH